MPLSAIRFQERAIGILKKAKAESRVASSYLFLGPRGIGKSSAALEFAKFLNCGLGKEDSCEECRSCLKMRERIHPDIFIMPEDNKQKSISIDDIRGLSKKLSLKPFEAIYRTVIIYAQALNEQASNALLKILEEPPPDTIFILTAHNRDALLDTIVSRCRVVRFNPLKKDEVVDILRNDFGIEEKEARLLSNISGSNLQKALLLKEQDIISRKNGLIDEFSAEDLSPELLNNSLADKPKQAQQEALDMLLCFYRDVIVYKQTQDAQLVINIDRHARVSELAKDKSNDSLQSAIKAIEKAKFALESNANSKLTLKLLQEELKI